LYFTFIFLIFNVIFCIVIVKPTAAIMGAGLGKDVALITDGRFSGASHVNIALFLL
jgi:hypothetical protein